ncbi:MAG: hypothetical protein M3O91_02540 [Chloroflexota bacterium]|nr:hypothetical protein [Chloroflexota bacterium]
MPRSLFALAALALGVGVGYALLGRAPRRDAQAQAALEGAVAAVDRELAANLELTTMFDQTRQAVVLENGEFARNRAVIERELPREHRGLAELYAGLPEAESAMERRGPAGSVTPLDRGIVETWEGDARESQRMLRAAVAAPPTPAWRRAALALADRLGRPSSLAAGRVPAAPGAVRASGATVE